MPSKLINTNLSGLSGGVSQQFNEGRYDSQVEEMSNCIPSISRGVLRRNPLEHVASVLIPNLKNAFIYSYDRGTGDEQYIIVITGDGSMRVIKPNSLTEPLVTIETAQTLSYLTIPEESLAKAKDCFQALTIGDHTFIVNTTKKIGFTTATAPTVGYADMAFYWVKKTVSVVTKQYQTETDVGSYMTGYTYTINNKTLTAYQETRPTASPEVANEAARVNLNTSEKIAEYFKKPGVEAYPHSEGSIGYKTGDDITSWNYTDTFGDQASLAVWKNVKDSDELPVNLPSALNGFIVKVSGGTSAEFDDYYLKYFYESKTWKEVAAPGSKTTLDPTTMPHVLYRLPSGFVFHTYQGVTDAGALDGKSSWEERTSGGQNTVDGEEYDPLDDPSFVGNSIKNIFFHKNRLGFLTLDSVVLSRTGVYGGFFAQTVQEVLDDDPIDLSVASTNVTILRHAVPTAGQLLIFSDDTQFKLESLEGTLTPKSADISPLSNYTYGAKASAQAIGNRVFFTNQVGGNSQIYSYKVSDQGSQITEATPMTLHLPTYLSKTLRRIVGHDVLGYVFFEEEENPKQLSVLSSIIRGSEELQNAFHRWEFEEDIASVQILKNDLYILFTTGNLTKMSLSIPSDITAATYLDEYTKETPDTPKSPYLSKVDFSEFFIRDANSKGTVRGRYQLRTMKYTASNNSFYDTIIADKKNEIVNTDIIMGPIWDDTESYNDTKLWSDVVPIYTRTYNNDNLVTILADSKRVQISFTSSADSPSKGFEVATVNIEGLFHQRSLRR